MRAESWGTWSVEVFFTVRSSAAFHFCFVIPPLCMPRPCTLVRTSTLPSHTMSMTRPIPCRRFTARPHPSAPNGRASSTQLFGLARFSTPSPRRRLVTPPSASATSTSSSTASRGASGMDIAGSRPTSKRAWAAIQETLKENDVKFVSPQEVAFAAARPGALLLDCRPPAEYEAGHIPGAASIPLYRPITGLSARAVARRAVFAFFGVLNGTESNPGFWPAVRVAAARSKEIIVYCNTGGKLEPSKTNASGQQSRSLSAAFEVVNSMVEEGYTSDGGTPFLGLSFPGGGRRPQVSVLKGGFYEWKKSGRAVEEGGSELRR